MHSWEVFGLTVSLFLYVSAEKNTLILFPGGCYQDWKSKPKYFDSEKDIYISEMLSPVMFYLLAFLYIYSQRKKEAVKKSAYFHQIHDNGALHSLTITTNLLNKYKIRMHSSEKGESFWKEEIVYVGHV